MFSTRYNSHRIFLRLLFIQLANTTCSPSLHIVVLSAQLNVLFIAVILISKDFNVLFYSIIPLQLCVCACKYNDKLGRICLLIGEILDRSIKLTLFLVNNSEKHYQLKE